MKHKEEGRVGERSENRPKHHKRCSPPPRRAHIWSGWVEGKGGIGEALGVRVAEADCHEQGTLPSLGLLPYNSTLLHTFLVSYSSQVVVAVLSDLAYMVYVS